MIKQYLRSIMLPLSLSAISLAVSLPFAGAFLYNWDSAQFALGLIDFNLDKHQPHPPGYPVYIALARMINFVLGDANRALIAVTMAMAVAAVYIFFRFARSASGSDRIAVVGTLFVIFNPLFWFYREVALTYTADALASVAVGYLAYKIVIEKRNGAFRPLSIVLGIMGGIRPTVVILCLPVYIACLGLLAYRARTDPESSGGHGWHDIAVDLLLFIVTTALWLVPTALIAGGFRKYLSLTRSQFSSVSGGIAAGAKPASKMVQLIFLYDTLKAVSLGLIVPLAATAAAFLRLLRRPAAENAPSGREARLIVLFFLLWVAPSMAVYAVGHMGNAGYILTVMPALHVAALPGLAVMMKRRATFAIALLALAGEALIFPLPVYDAARLSRGPVDAALSIFNDRISPATKDYSAQALRANDRMIKAILRDIDRTAAAAGGLDRVLVIVPDEFAYHREGAVRFNRKLTRHLRFYYPGNAFIDIGDRRSEKTAPAALVFSSRIRAIAVVAEGIDSEDLPRGAAVRKLTAIYSGEIAEPAQFSFLGNYFRRE